MVKFIADPTLPVTLTVLFGTFVTELSFTCIKNLKHFIKLLESCYEREVQTEFYYLLFAEMPQFSHPDNSLFTLSVVPLLIVIKLIKLPLGDIVSLGPSEISAFSVITIIDSRHFHA